MSEHQQFRILVFSPYYPPHVGGLESHAQEWNHHMAERGHRIVVCTPRLPDTSPEYEKEHEGVSVIRFPAFEIIPNYPVPKFWLLSFWRQWRRAVRERPDVVVSRTRFFLTSLMAFWCAKTRRVPWIHVEHGSDYVILSNRWKSLIAKLYDNTVGRLVFKMSTINVSISEAVRLFVSTFDKRVSPVIYRGIDVDEIDSISPDESIRKKYEGKIVIVSVGRLYKWKGTDRTIEAVKALPSEVKVKIQHIVIGDGEDKEALERIASEKTIFLGQLPRNKVIAIMKSANIFIHSSHPGGGLSTSLLEAMYCGCAVVATRHEGASEVVRNEENGILISNPDLESMRRGILVLIRDEERRIQYAQKAMDTIRKRFHWNKSSEAYNDVIQSMRS